MLIINCNDVNNNNCCVNKFVENKIANNIEEINNDIVKNIFKFVI